MSTTDVFIIGGGPAGLAAAIAARRKGFQVTVADAVTPPADKACGEGLMPDALQALAKLGVRVGPMDSFPFRGIRFHGGADSVAADFRAGVGRGIRRTALHRILVEHAESSGIELRWGRHVDLDKLRCRWVVGADGAASSVRKWAGLDRRLRDRQRFGFRRHYRLEPWTDYMEIYWGNGFQIYVTPVSPQSVCVAIISRDAMFRLDDGLRFVPELSRRLRAAPILTPERGAVSSWRRLEKVYRDPVALIGDASGSVDAITGEGLCLAFRQASALAHSLESGDLESYQHAHRRIARRPDWMACLLLTLGASAPLHRAAIRVLSAYPAVFEKMLAIHTGALHEIYPSYLFDGRSGALRTGNCSRTRSGPNASPVHSD